MENLRSQIFGDCYRFVQDGENDWIPEDGTLAKLEREHGHYHGNILNIKMALFRVYIKDSKNCCTRKMIAYGSYYYFAPVAAANFLERELDMKRGLSGGKLILIHFHPWLSN